MAASSEGFRVVTDDGASFACWSWGAVDAPALLLHHATGFCAAVWQPIVEELCRSYRVFTFDARGHGASHQHADDVSWDSYGADLIGVGKAIAVRFGFNGFFGGVGHSMGGVAMLRAALDEPGLFQRLCLVEPVLVPHGMSSGRSAMSVRTRMRQELFGSLDEARLVLSGPYAAWDPRVFEHYLSGAFRQDAQGVRLCCRPQLEARIYELGYTRVLDDLGGLVPPAYVLSARRSHFADAHQAAALACPAFQLEVVDATHLAPMEAPSLVLAWLARSLCA